MASDNYRQASLPFWQYDSDTDLPPEVQQKLAMYDQSMTSDPNIMSAYNTGQQAEALRQNAWNQAGSFDKLKSFLKAAAMGDIRNKGK